MDLSKPLAYRVRPKSLEEFVGQEHVVGKDKLLYRTIKADRLSSLILWGPPGCGKTSLAKVISETTKYKFTKLNAVTSGVGDIKKAIDVLKADALSLNSKLTFKFIPEDALPLLLENYPDEFEVTEDRDKFDYIYLSDKMITLSGKKLHAKRNHINAFMRDNSWSYEPISANNIAECEAMSEKWCELYGCSNNLSLTHETCAVKNALAYFSDLDLRGGLLRKDGEVIAFTIGEPLTDDTFVIHIEKAFHEIRGAYPMINQQFATHNCKDYKYINREEDTGDEGLRKAKLSYYPVILYKKYSAVL